MSETRKLQVQKNGQTMITVPKQLVRALGWEKGDELEWEVEESDALKLRGKG